MKKLLFIVVGCFFITAFNSASINEDLLNDLELNLEQAKQESTPFEKVKEQLYSLMGICMKSEIMAKSFDKDLKYLLNLCKQRGYKIPEEILWKAETCKYNKQLIETLIEYGNLNVNYVNKNESVTNTPLLRFINYWPETVHLLLIKNADPNLANSKYGLTPLMWAANSEIDEDPQVIEDKKQIIDDLLFFGAKVDKPDNKGKYPLDYAKNKEIEKYLRHKIVDNINLKN